MLNMIKKTWNNVVDYTQKTWNSAYDKAGKNWLQLTLGGIFALSLATFNVVFPAAVFPTFVTLATLAAGSALYFVGKAIASFFREENAPAAKAPAAKKEESKDSTTKMSIALVENKTKDAGKEATDAPKLPVQAPTVDAANEQKDEHDAEEVAAFRLS